MSCGRVIAVGEESSHDGAGRGGYDAPVRLRAAPALLALALLAATSARGATRSTGGGPAPGLAFAVTLRGDGAALAAGPYLLRIPGGSGALEVELAGLSTAGSALRGSVKARNASGLLLAGLTLDVGSASATPKDGSPGPGGSVPLRLREAVALGDLLPGEETPLLEFETGPLPVGDDVLLVTLLGAVTGFAVAPPVLVEGATQPVALDCDRSDRLYVATAGVGRVLRLWPLGPGTPVEAARPEAPPAGVALRRRNGELWVSSGGSTLEAFPPGRKRAVKVEAGGPAGTLRIDAKGTLRAASGNAVVTFDGAMPGPGRVLGPAGSRVVSFDTDPGGVLHAVVAEGESRGLVVGGASGPAPFAAPRGPGAEVLAAPRACRFDGEGSLWVAAPGPEPESAVLARFGAGDGPRPVLSRLALALLLGKDEDAAVPEIVDLAPGSERRTWVLLEDGHVFAARPF